MEHEEGVMGTPIYSWSVSSTGKTTEGLQLVFKVGEQSSRLSPQPVGPDAISK